MTRQLVPFLLIAAVAGVCRDAAAQYQLDRTYRTNHGDVHVYEIPLRDRDDYNPTYEEAARRKEDGYPLNNKELKALRRGPRGPKPGSIDEDMLLRRQRNVLRNEAESNIYQMEAGTDMEIRRSNAVIETGTDADIERMKAQHDLELKRQKAELELELEYERRKRELRRDAAPSTGSGVVIEDVVTTRAVKRKAR